MNRSLATSSLWILAATAVLVVALVPFDPVISQRAQGLPGAIVAFNERITDFGTFSWMIYGSGFLVVLAYVAYRISRNETSGSRMRTAWRLPLYFLITTGATSALVHLVKLLVGRARPELFAEHGAYIIEQRIAFTEQLNQNLAGLYQEIAGTHDDVSIHYSHTFVGDIKQKLLNELHAHLERDRYLGNTSVGPHRHDVIFEINHSPALSTASRGEARTIVLALKFLEVDIIEQLTGKTPIILLDDVFSELDATRQQLLTSQLKGHQIIITSATSHAGKHLHHIELLAE